MEEKMVSYLKSIGMGERVRERVTEIYDFYYEVCPEEITRIFVTDYVEKDGERIFGNLWFFSEHYAMEAKNFISTDDFDMVRMEGFGYWQIKKKDYDFEKATEKSNLFIKCNLVGFDVSTCDLKASKENWDYLKQLFLDIILPKFTSVKR